MQCYVEMLVRENGGVVLHACGFTKVALKSHDTR